LEDSTDEIKADLAELKGMRAEVQSLKESVEGKKQEEWVSWGLRARCARHFSRCFPDERRPWGSAPPGDGHRSGHVVPRLTLSSALRSTQKPFCLSAALSLC